MIKYHEKYYNIYRKMCINTEDDKISILENIKDTTLLEHTIYDLIMMEYNKDHAFDRFSDLYFIGRFFENDNIEWIKNYWKYIKKTDIYKDIFFKEDNKKREKKNKKLYDQRKENITYLYFKHKVELDPIISEAYFIEDISNDDEFIFNKVNKLKHIGRYKIGYTKAILDEVDFILRNIGNKEILSKKYDFNNLYDIYYYKTILNIDYYTINLFKSISGKKMEKKIIKMSCYSNNGTPCSPFRKKNKYYISGKYEIPFTLLNRKYKTNPDNYIISYMDTIKYYIKDACISLKNKIETNSTLNIEKNCNSNTTSGFK
eukprot:jgi/Orpsp1_1/1189035/evm.model.d7180000069005.1